MLKLSDSRNFSRTLASFGLLIGPAMFVVGGLIQPVWSDNSTTYLDQVAGARSLHLLSGVIWSAGSIMFVAGLLGVVKLMRGRAVTLGQFGAGLMAIGIMLFSGSYVFYAVDVLLADYADRAAAAEILGIFQESGLIGLFFMTSFLVCIMIGSLLLAVALIRRRIVAIWSPIVLILSVVVGFFAETQLLNTISFVLLTAALAPLAARMWCSSDEAWGNWEQLEATVRE